MDTCIFCKIVKRDIPAHIVYEDSLFLAFLSIDPCAPGHTLVIPKNHHRWVWDVPQIGTYFEVTQRIAHAQRKAFKTECIQSKIVGEEVPHAHIWVFPDPSVDGNKKDLSENANKLRRTIIK